MIENVVFITVQPNEKYFAWQLDVQIKNFLSLGIKKENIIPLVCYFPQHPIHPSFGKLRKKYDIEIFYYEDTRDSHLLTYISSLRPHCLKKHFDKFPELSKVNVFYHDADIVFRALPDFEMLCKDDIWYLSDTNSYINASYIKSKGDDILDKMCEIVGVSKEKVESIDNHSGGAQYLMKGVDARFWSKVELDCATLYKFMVESRSEYEKKHFAKHEGKYHEIQAWCADMWSVLWNALYFNYEVKIHEQLSFSWATSQMSEWEKHNIYHNAGVTPDLKEKIFFKGQYIGGLPKTLDITSYDRNFCGYKYAELVKESLEIE